MTSSLSPFHPVAYPRSPTQDRPLGAVIGEHRPVTHGILNKGTGFISRQSSRETHYSSFLARAEPAKGGHGSQVRYSCRSQCDTRSVLCVFYFFLCVCAAFVYCRGIRHISCRVTSLGVCSVGRCHERPLDAEAAVERHEHGPTAHSQGAGAGGGPQWGAARDARRGEEPARRVQVRAVSCRVCLALPCAASC
jgi:hypothetical protein